MIGMLVRGSHTPLHRHWNVAMHLEFPRQSWQHMFRSSTYSTSSPMTHDPTETSSLANLCRMARWSWMYCATVRETP